MTAGMGNGGHGNGGDDYILVGTWDMEPILSDDEYEEV